MLPEMTNVNGGHVRLDGSSAAWAWALGRTLGCPLGSPRVASRAGLSGCDTAVLPDQPALGV